MNLLKAAIGAALLLVMIPAMALAQYAAGQLIEYKDGSSWLPGVVVGMTPGNSQVILRRQPSTYFPEGFQAAYSLEDVRPRQLAQPAPNAQQLAAQIMAGRGGAAQPAQPKAPAPAPGRGVAPIPQGGGLLSQADVLAYARQAMGPTPYANPNREQALANIRDFIKGRGVNFHWSLDFDNQLGATGAGSVHITSAISSNFGPNPALSVYYGNFNLTSQVRGAQSVGQAGGRTVVTTTDAAARLGSIQINADHTYVWTVGTGGAPIRGQWREASADEKQLWEGGPAIWLLHARDGQDYNVRADRQEGYAGWIDLGQTKGRIAVQYGQPARR